MRDELTHWRRWVNSMWPRDTAWLHRSRSTLIHVMACCLTAPSHYLNQYWLTIRRILHHAPEDNSYMEMPLKVATTMYLKITHLISKPHPPGNNELKEQLTEWWMRSFREAEKLCFLSTETWLKFTQVACSSACNPDIILYRYSWFS